MKQSPSPSGRLTRHLAADPFPWAMWLLIRRTASKLKSAYLGRVFGARGLFLGPGCTVIGSRFISFGANVYAQGHLWLEAVSTYKDQRFQPTLEIGDHVSISERVHVSCIERIQIGKRVLIGSNVYIGDHHHGLYNGPVQTTPEVPPAFRPLGGGGPVIIGDDVWIGDNAVIVGPVSIGRGAIIGANSVVRSNLSERTMAAGAPARAIKWFNDATHEWERIQTADLHHDRDREYAEDSEL
jgi:acetyltransferase-like isoleucine patch superfamily enzyme